jgi:hypothetical protein
MEEDEDTVGVGEVALVLLDPGPGHRAAELGDQAGPQQLGEIQAGDVGAVGLGPAVGPALAGVQDVDERPPASRMASMTFFMLRCRNLRRGSRWWE